MTSANGNFPYQFNYINAYNSQQNPSTIHASDTGLSNFFARYLLQKAISVFRWKCSPLWEKNYFLYCLYCWGFFAVINTDKYGVIPQGCSLKGYNVMYAPTNAVIANPLLTGILEPKIGVQCEIVRLQPDYGGIWDLVSFYADMMSMTAATAGSNIMASKLAYVYAAKNAAFRESFKKMADKVLSGEPAVVVDKNMTDENGNINIQQFSSNLKGNYIATQLLEDLDSWETRFDAELGLPKTNTDKRERLVTGEVNANISHTYCRVAMWLETLKECCDKVNKMFGEGTLNVEWRYDPKQALNVSRETNTTEEGE